MLLASGTAKPDRLPRSFLSPSSTFRAEQVTPGGPGELSLMDSFLWVGIQPSGLLKYYLVTISLCICDNLTRTTL